MTDEDARRALRELMRSRRTQIAPAARLAAADTVATRLRSLDVLQRASTVAGYWAVQGELGLHALFAPPPPFTYCLPLLMRGKRLRFAAWRFGEPLVSNAFGIPEPDVDDASTLAPQALDAVLLPLLAFDRHGTRLGTGGGYYDRSFEFLAQRERPARPLLIGVAYGFQEVERLPRASWDIGLDYVATDAELIRCCE